MPSEEYDDFYKRLRKRVRRWARSKEVRASQAAEYVLLAPDLFHLLLRLSLDKRVPRKEKAKLAVAMAYFVSPIDIVPEVLTGPIGYVDDVGLAIYVIHSIIKEAGPDIVSAHWAGDEDILAVTERFLERADNMLGSGLWGRLKALVDSPKKIFDLQKGEEKAATPTDGNNGAKAGAAKKKAKATKKKAAKKKTTTKSAAAKRAKVEEDEPEPPM